MGLKDKTEKTVQDTTRLLNNSALKKTNEATVNNISETPSKKKWEELKRKSSLGNSLSPHSTPTANGRSGSLEVPRSPGSSPGETRRPSNMSRLSSIDYSKVANQQQEADIEAKRLEEERKKALLTGQESSIRAAIPALPLWAAVACLIANVTIPGSGTLAGGMSLFCCGRKRPAAKDESSAVLFCLNFFVAMSQLFTVTFFLVGWFWSLVWGIYMVILAVERKKRDAERKRKEIQAKALSALSSQVRPWTLKT